MKIGILYQFKEGPYGGANQFLKVLKNTLAGMHMYESDNRLADALIANANPGGLPLLLRELPRYKRINPRGIVLIRIDGPIALVRGRDAYIDRSISRLITLFADAVIYQSRWSKEQNKKLSFTQAPYEQVIYNAPDPAIFHIQNGRPIPPHKKIRLIATSWSNNIRKGFDIYRFLDTHVDWAQYDMTFIGNSPLRFRQIRTLPPMPSPQLADMLRQHDIYITASQHDPCSNSLIEAMMCGLPAVVRRSGGHLELLGRGGVSFTNQDDILDAIDRTAQQLPALRDVLPVFSIDDTATRYVALASAISRDIHASRYTPKPLSMWHSGILRLGHMSRMTAKTLTTS